MSWVKIKLWVKIIEKNVWGEVVGKKNVVGKKC